MRFALIYDFDLLEDMKLTVTCSGIPDPGIPSVWSDLTVCINTSQESSKAMTS